eukprot:scaffold7842_cov27-Tisochrysis_lutea.AAC.3
MTARKPSLRKSSHLQAGRTRHNGPTHPKQADELVCWAQLHVRVEGVAAMHSFCRLHVFQLRHEFEGRRLEVVDIQISIVDVLLQALEQLERIGSGELLQLLVEQTRGGE